MGHSHSTFSEQSAVLTLDFLPATSSKSGTASADRSSLANKTEVHTAKGGEPGSSPKPPTVEKSETPPQLASRKAKNRSFSPFGKRRPHLRRISNATLHIAHKSKPSKVVDTRPTAADRRGAKPRVLLAGCANSEEHFGRVDTVMGMTRGLRGKKGLEAVGFEYLMTSCSADQPGGVEIGGGRAKMHQLSVPVNFPRVSLDCTSAPAQPNLRFSSVPQIGTNSSPTAPCTMRSQGCARSTPKMSWRRRAISSGSQSVTTTA